MGMEFDSGSWMLAGGCYWSSPGGLPLSPPPLFRAGCVRIKIRQFRKQYTKRSIIEVREKGVSYVREKLTNKINTGCCTRKVQKLTWDQFCCSS